MVSATVLLALSVVVLAVFGAVGIRASQGAASAEAFVTARGTAGPATTTATLIASVMGVWILINPAEAGAAFGGVSAVAGYAVGEALPMLAFSWVGPRIRRLIPEGHSLTEYAYVRFGRATYALVLGVSLLYMFVFLAAELTGITTVFAELAGVPRAPTALLVAGAALAYTAYGGLRASLVTDAVQTALILPLLAVAAVAVLAALGGTAAFDAVGATDPTLLDPGFVGGLRFGVYVSIAILGAELVNQTWWQRIYAARDPAALKRGFRIAAVVNAALVFVAGLFGVLARGHADLVVDPASDAYDASAAFFVLLDAAFGGVAGEVAVLGVALLALALVASSADSLYNAIASLVTADLPRLLDDPDDRTLTLAARSLTVVTALAAVYVSIRARSVLRLFLFADLLGVAVAGPLVAGLYSNRLPGLGAVATIAAALGAGIAWFPAPIRPAIGGVAPGLAAALPDPAFLPAFVGAAVVSVAGTAASVALPTGEFVPDRLRTEVRRLGGDR
jgi:Na+/proline symporter